MIPSPCYFILIVPEKEMKSSAEAMLKGSPQEDLPNFSELNCNIFYSIIPIE